MAALNHWHPLDTADMCKAPATNASEKHWDNIESLYLPSQETDLELWRHPQSTAPLEP